MGTHPIFESDFDCLTDSKREDMNRLLLARATTRQSKRFGGGSNFMPQQIAYRWHPYADPFVTLVSTGFFTFFWARLIYMSFHHNEHHLFGPPLKPTTYHGLPAPCASSTSGYGPSTATWAGYPAGGYRDIWTNEELGLPADK